MPRHSPSSSRSRADYTGYEFTASAGFDYNYDPVGGRTPPNKHFDPYADHYSSSPNSTNYHHQEYNSTNDGYSRSYDRSPQRYPRSPRDYRSSQDYMPPQDHRSSRDYRAPPHYDDHRNSGQNGRKRRGSPRYDDYAGGSDDHPFEPSSNATAAPSWKIPALPLPVPAPTPTSVSDDYIRESEKPSSRLENPSSSRKLLILDLNGTLVFRSPHLPREYKPRHRRNNYKQNQQDRASSPPHNPDPYADPIAIRPLRAVHPRPYLTPFREYLFHPSTREWLDTMVWSSAQPHSVADMVEQCFGEKKDDLVAIWARDTLGLAAKDYNRKTQTTKDLAKPWAALPLPSSNPSALSTSTSAGQIHSARTTILLDDSPLKAHLQPHNHLCIREYVAELRNADLAFRSSEDALLHESDSGPEEQETPLMGSEVQSSAEESPVTDRSEPHGADEAGEQHPGSGEGRLGLEEAATGKRKRRRRPKPKKQVTEQGGTATSDQLIPLKSHNSALSYDQTLLAVIGILDHVKRESNVAGWMRSGGLLRSGAQGKGKAGQEEEEGLESSQEEGRDLKRRRISPEPLSAGATVVAPSLSEANADDTTVTQNGTGQWYDNSPSMAYWVSQGIEALEELAIEIVPGVEA